MPDLGEALREWRKANDLNMRQAAAVIGISYCTVSEVEAHKREVSTDTQAIIREAIGLAPESRFPELCKESFQRITYAMVMRACKDYAVLLASGCEVYNAHSGGKKGQYIYRSELEEFFESEFYKMISGDECGRVKKMIEDIVEKYGSKYITRLDSDGMWCGNTEKEKMLCE